MHAVLPLANEFDASVFADERLRKRASRIVEQLSAEPSLSFPNAVRDDSQLEAYYRFVGNERVQLDDIISGHVAKTLKRASEKKRCLALHDTTDFTFDGEREGLGRVDRAKKGFYAHVCLCVSADGQREPLGVLAIDPWTRAAESKGKRSTTQRKSEPDNESLRWLEQSLNVEDLVGTAAQLIHVEDREGDVYESLEMRLSMGMHFIVRAMSTKVALTDEGEENILLHARTLPLVTTRDIHLSERKEVKKSLKPQHPARAQRDTAVEIRAGQVRLRKPIRSGTMPELILNAVHVREMRAPDAEQPVEWLLLTTEPVTSKEEVEDIVDNYRARWLIEEYFKALKTGCKYEERQLESLHALLNALGLFAVMAWRILQLRFIERTASDAPATTIASAVEIKILEAKARLPPNATAQQFMKHLARYGGHLSQNGRPGIIILWRALRDLRPLVEGYEMAQKM